jgi:glycosyltransferase A (GT-A) superfamily protein (DUF2064 family)
MKCTLVVFCRRPKIGIGKQRIAADLGDAEARSLAGYLLATALEDADNWPGPVVVSPADEADTSWAETLTSVPREVIAQPEGNLGQRINAVDNLARKGTHTHLIYIGSDAPLLDADYFSRAMDALETNDVVIGPAEDGGVTLMGARCAWPDLANLPWSSERLGESLELLCQTQGLKVMSLDQRYDIDFASDLPRLLTELEGDTRPAREKLRQWLAQSPHINRKPKSVNTLIKAHHANRSHH